MAKRHFIIPDLQARPGVPTDHLRWIGAAIAEYRPDVVVNIGDTYDLPSLNSHEEPGSLGVEGQRYKADIEAGLEAFRLISEPMDRESKRSKAWRPRKVFCLGNHEQRADTTAANNPKFFGHIGSDNCESPGWERHKFLEIVPIDGFLYSHYFQNTHSGRPIGGSILNRLTKIGASFVHGHVQGLDMGTKIMGSGRTWWGFQAGSAYLHEEQYRGAQGQRHWRGVLVLNEVEDGECQPMPLSLGYLCRKFERMDLGTYMARKYGYSDWNHLKRVAA